MKEIEFRDLDKMKYNIMDNFKQSLQDTDIYRKLNSHGAIEFNGELYSVDMYCINQHPSVTIVHIDTHTIAFSDCQFPKDRDNPSTIYKNCRYLGLKILDDWIKEAKRKHYGVEPENELKR